MEIDGLNLVSLHQDDESLAQVQRGVFLEKIISEKFPEIDDLTKKVLLLLLNQNPDLSRVEVVFDSDHEKIYSGGSFNVIEVEEGVFIPTISINNAMDIEKIKQLFRFRKFSVEIISKMMGIDSDAMTPELLRIYIILHEFGHALDFIKNYEQNEEYGEGEAVEAWDFHYDSNKSLFPYEGMDPAELLEEIMTYDSFDQFLEAHREQFEKFDLKNIESLKDLMLAQEIAYRSSPFEKYADDFALKFLKNNATELGLLIFDQPKKSQKKRP